MKNSFKGYQLTEGGSTQKDVAKALEKTQSYVSKIEMGQIRVDVIQLKELANLYKKPLEFFLED
ncbi:MAG: helix-turn-helix transcriptional regulator [Actinomycetota bacterium]|nr:helix-turn-helix transcriptional regulator [Actinomycetota bacterium]